MDKIKDSVINCPNCGAPITGANCEYAKEQVKEETEGAKNDGCEYWDGESNFCALHRPADPKNLPSAQPEIIRCKECKWWIEKHPRLGVPWCRQMHLDRNADGYCDMAERSEDE